MRNDENLIYIGNRSYQKTTLLIDTLVIEALRKKPDQTATEVINEILLKELLKYE